MSIQVAILKVLASHSSGRTTLSSLRRDIAILAASGPEWSARIRRLASRVPSIDIFGNGYVLRDNEGWEITAEGRDFLAMLEAVTQDNLPSGQASPKDAANATEANGTGDLIVVGHRFKTRVNRSGTPACKAHGIGANGGIRCGENASS